MVKEEFTIVLLGSLVKVMLGAGTPVALQIRYAESLSFFVWLPKKPVMFGGTIKSKQQYLRYVLSMRFVIIYSIGLTVILAINT